MKKIVAISVILILLLLIRGILSSITTHVENDKTVLNLQDKLKQKEKEDQFLSEKLYYVKTNEFVEKEAREKLGMVREGEHIVIAPPPPRNASHIASPEEKPVYRKWMELFKF